MKSWDYEKVYNWDEVLALGKVGWELVNFVQIHEKEVYMLKRLHQGIKQKITQEQSQNALIRK